jgi:ribosomal-protein-serine acetyltransferase
MLAHALRPGITMRLLERRHASTFFDFIEEGRSNFEDWIPFVSKTKSVETAEAKIMSFLQALKDGTGYFWGLWDDDKIIGLILIKDIDGGAKTAEIGYMIDKKYEGMGIMRQSCEAMIDFIFEELKLNKIVLCCDDMNERSVAIARRFGFEHEGTLKESMLINDMLRNTMHWGLLKKNYIKRL